MRRHLVEKGLAAAKSEAYEEALTHFEAALTSINQHAPIQRAMLHQYICVLHKLLFQYEKALLHAKQAIKAEPRNFKHWGNLANLQRDMHDFALAIANYDKALQICLEPKAGAQLRFNKAMAQLTLGDYIQGAKGFLAKAEAGKERKLSDMLTTVKRWNGESLQNKRVLIYAIEGYGDCLQWLRFVPLFKHSVKATEVGFCPHDALANLLLQNPTEQPLETLSTFTLYRDLGTALTQSAFDVWLPLYTLLHLCQAQVHCLPTPWTRVFAAVTPRLKPTLPTKLKVGLVWQVNPAAPTAKRRNIPLSYFQPLLAHAQIYRLQLQAQLTPEEKTLALYQQSKDLSMHIKDFADTAGWLKQMDILITADTVTAHLGAALGIKTWLLLSFSADWRWMLERTDSPWYPDHKKFRIFRQPAPGKWEAVISEVKQELIAIKK